MQLNQLQLQHYETFGFLMVRDFLDPEMVQALRETLTRMKTEESGETDPLKHSGRVNGMFHTDALHRELFDDPRLFAIAKQLLGESKPVRFLGDEYASFSTPADWHPDMLVETPFESLKFGFYLDDLSHGGWLNVVPGSHLPQLSGEVERYRSLEKPTLDCAFPCMTNPGDLLIFNLKLWHQGTANQPGTHRRVIFWSLGQDDPQLVQFARKFHAGSGRGSETEPWPAGIIHDLPVHRRQMLDVYEAGTAKSRSLV